MSDRQKYDTVQHTLVAAVGAGASFTVAYPFGKSADDYVGGTDHRITSHTIRPIRALANEFSIAFGASNMTVTLAIGTALPIGAILFIELDRAGEEEAEDVASSSRMIGLRMVRMLFGAIATAVANGVCASQSLLSTANGLINGSLAASSIATFATPRNVVAAWTNTAVLTVTGTDEYGASMVESSASGTSFTGKKAFKTITKVRVSADVTGLTVGSGVVIGLPVYVPDAIDVFREVTDAAIPTAGTIVAGDRTTPTATTGDVRGTWAPNQAPNGAKIYELWVALRSLSAKGLAQFTA